MKRRKRSNECSRKAFDGGFLADLGCFGRGGAHLAEDFVRHVEGLDLIVELSMFEWHKCFMRPPLASNPILKCSILAHQAYPASMHF